MRSDNTAALRRAAEQCRYDTLARARAAIRRLAKTGEPVTFITVAREAHVSRAWLYAEPDIRAAIQQLRERTLRLPAPRQCPRISDPAKQACCVVWRSPTNATAN
jgi:hypothetical protein